MPRVAKTLLGWTPLPPIRRVQPARLRRRAPASHQPPSQQAPLPPLQLLQPRSRRAHQPPLYRESPLAEPWPPRLPSIPPPPPLPPRPSQLVFAHARPAIATIPPARSSATAGATAGAPGRARFTPLVAALSLCSSVALALWYVIRFCLRRRP
jgi:hypothetical protein